MLTNAITSLIDYFYPLFRKMMPLNTYRYAACGGANVALDIALFFIFYNFIYNKKVVDIGFFAFEPHTTAFLSAFVITFPVGFLLSKYVVWSHSNIRGHVQLFRYFLIVMMNLLLNYIFLKLFVEYAHIYPTVAKLITTVILITFSYLGQKHYTFRVNKIKAG